MSPLSGQPGKYWETHLQREKGGQMGNRERGGRDRGGREGGRVSGKEKSFKVDRIGKLEGEKVN